MTVVKAQNKNQHKNQNKDSKDFTSFTYHNFLNSLSDVLIDITALEVNTMVVEQITGNKFIPWEAYRDIYLISQAHFERLEIHPSLQHSYLSLRKKLEMEYCLFLLEDGISPLQVSELSEYYQMLGDPTLELDLENTKLPSPFNSGANTTAEIEKIQILLSDGRFLRSLRKMNELKVALDNRNRALKQAPEAEVTTDIIYAQTIIQMDGDIINRYDRKILEHQHKDMILDIHRQGVTAGEKQWRGVLEFIIDLVESLVNKVSSSNGSNNRN